MASDGLGNKDEVVDDRAFGGLLAIGISSGFMLGLLLDNLGMGLSFGLSLAVFINAINEKRRQRKGSTTALVVSVIALIAIIGLWFGVG
jgi:hypothetical protein